MFRYSKFALCFLPFGLAGCVGAPLSAIPDLKPGPIMIHKPLPTGASLDNACGAAGLRSLVGQPLAVLDRTPLLSPPRVLHPDTVTTKDYLATRLNVSVDAKEIITNIYCG